MNKKVIVFDFDGVIADSFHIAFRVNQMSKPTLTEDRYRAMFNGNIGDAVHTDEVVREIDFQEEYAKQFKELSINEGIRDSVKKLASSYQMFIISSTINQTIQDYLERHGISDCFREIFGFDVEKSKIKKFKMLFDKYTIDPHDVVFITDTSGDVREAREAGVEYIVGILGGYQNEESLKQSSPTVIVNDFQEFYNLVA